MNAPDDPALPAFPLRRAAPLEPPALYGWARAHRPVLPVRLWNGKRAWLITRHDDFKALLQDQRLSGSFAHPSFPAITAAREQVDRQNRTFRGMDNPRHHYFRRMLTKEFSVKRVAQLRPMIDATAAALVDALQRRGPPADIVEDFAIKLPGIVLCELMGAPHDDHPFLRQCVAVRHGMNQTPGAVEHAAGDLFRYVLGLVEKKKTAPGDDLLTRLYTEQVATGALSVDELVDIGAEILMAGFDTTANTIALGVYLFLCHPDQIARLRSDPGLIEGAVEEVLRYLSPNQFSPRLVALEDIDLRGEKILAGEGLFLLNAAANRDPGVFQDPDVFDIGKDAALQVALGYGIHQCLGQMLARAELQAAYLGLLTRLDGLRLAVPEEELRFKTDMQMYGIYHLPVTWDAAGGH